MGAMNRGRLSTIIHACRGTTCRALTVDRLLRTIILFVLTAAPIPALADYASIYGLSPRAAAMGGAFTAVADDTSAVFYNPAGLALDRPDALVAGYVFAAPRIRLREDLTGEEYTAFNEELSAGQIGLTLAMDPIFTSLNRRFVVGMLISYTGDTKVASWVATNPWSERQLPVSGRAQDVMVMAYGAGLEIFPWLRIGAGFRFNVTYNAHRMEFTFRVPELEFVVNRIDIKAETEMAPMAGLLVRPTERLSIGLTWRREHSVANIVAYGCNRIEFFDDLLIELPLKSAGVRYAVSPNRILRKPLFIDGAIQYKYLPSRHFDTASGSFRTWGHVFGGAISVTLQF